MSVRVVSVSVKVGYTSESVLHSPKKMKTRWVYRELCQCQSRVSVKVVYTSESVKMLFLYRSIQPEKDKDKVGVQSCVSVRVVSVSKLCQCQSWVHQ